MLRKEILDAIQKLDYSNVPFSEITERLYYEDVMGIMELNKYEQEDEIVAALPNRIRFLYLILWLQTTIMNDGLLSVFYNHSFFEFKRFIEVVKSAGMTDLTELVEKALQVILSKFPLPKKDSHTFMQDADEDAQPYDFFGEDIGNAIGEIGEEIDGGLFSSDEFWNRVETVWKTI